MNALDRIRAQIIDDPDNAWARPSGYSPIYAAHRDARIVIIGQAPGLKAQQSGTPWDDLSGVALRKWLGVDDATFYNPARISLLPMDFYYPGKGQHGDLPPRPEFAARWHPLILEHLRAVQLTVLIGTYAQKHYLGAGAKQRLTDTVRAWESFLPSRIPLVHPSPLNFRWRARNPWFERDVVPALQARVAESLADSADA